MEGLQTLVEPILHCGGEAGEAVQEGLDFSLLGGNLLLDLRLAFPIKHGIKLLGAQFLLCLAKGLVWQVLFDEARHVHQGPIKFVLALSDHGEQRLGSFQVVGVGGVQQGFHLGCDLAEVFEDHVFELVMVSPKMPTAGRGAGAPTPVLGANVAGREAIAGIAG